MPDIKKGSVLKTKISFSNIYKGSVGVCYGVEYIQYMGIYFFLFDQGQKLIMFMSDIKSMMDIENISYCEYAANYEWKSDPQLLNDFSDGKFDNCFKK